MSIVEKLSGKKILIWGYGREGKSTENFIRTHCRDVELEIYEGKTLEQAESAGFCDYIIKSPGIPYFTEDERVISQTSLFLEEFSENTIGITGTKGKSTTTSMLYSVFDRMGADVLLVGNIGLPCLDYYDSIKEDTVVVFEMSCHQLALLKQSPHISVLLNIFEDHLDYYKTVERYADAKYNILRYQKEDDVCIVNETLSFPFELKGKKIAVRMPKEGTENFELSIVGHCHQYNAQVVFEIAAGLFGFEKEKVLLAIREFKGLAHRLQEVAVKEGVRYYDDSISTICESAIEAMESVPGIDSILIGGLDRGIDYSILADYLKEHTRVKVICMYESGKKIFQMISNRPNCYLVKDLEEAVKKAKEITCEGGACVLSPAAASYGYFKNFEERGDCFRKLVLQ